MNLNKHSKVRAVGLSSSFALLALLGLAVFCPGMNDNANAAESNATFQLDFVLDRQQIETQVMSSDISQVVQANNDVQSTATFLVDFLLAPKLSISIDGLTNATQTVNPTAGGQTASQQVSFTAASNSLDGIGVVVYSGSTTLSNGTSTIPTIASGTKSGLDALDANTWGYNLTPATNAPNADNLIYSPMGTNAGSAVSPVPAADSLTNSQKYWLTFGAKVSRATNPGTYTNTVSVKVVPSATSTAAANEIAKSVKSDSVLYNLDNHNDESGEAGEFTQANTPADETTTENATVVDAE